MTEDDARPARRAPAGSGTAMSERMQALLSRAAEEQLSEQRQVSAVLAELRSLVAGLAEQLRGTASSARLEGLGGDVSSLLGELRRSTSGLAQRLDELGRRVDEQATATSEAVRTSGTGADGVAVRLTALGSDLAEQGEVLDRLARAVEVLPGADALTAVGREVSALQARLGPLGEVHAGVAELAAASGTAQALRDDVARLAARVDGLATPADLTRMSETLGAVLDVRLVRLEAAAGRPVLTAERLDQALERVVARVDAAGEPVARRLGGVDERLQALEARLTALDERLAAVGASADGIPGVAAAVAGVAARVDELSPVRAQVEALHGELSALREDVRLPQVMVSLGGLREDVEDLAGHLAQVDVPTADAVGAAVTASVTDRLVGELAPRVADLVLARVAETLVDQVSGAVATSVQHGLTERVRAVNADTERRLSAHVDEAVLALAEALLRRRRGGRGPVVTVDADPPSEPGPGVVDMAPTTTAAPGDGTPGTAAYGGELDPDAVVPHDDAPAAADVDAAATSDWPQDGAVPQDVTTDPPSSAVAEPASAEPTCADASAPDPDDEDGDGQRRAWWRPTS